MLGILRNTCSDSITKTNVLVHMGYSTVVARYVAGMCLCEHRNIARYGAIETYVLMQPLAFVNSECSCQRS